MTNMTNETRLSLGINLSLFMIIAIFGVLLSMPLRMLFEANYSDRSQKKDERNVTGTETDKESLMPMDHRKLRRCPNLQYESRLMSVFVSDYDENCTYVQDDDDDDDDDDDGENDSGSEEAENNSEEDASDEICVPNRGIAEVKENAEEILKTRQMKSVTVAGHILVTMLVVSVIAALVEVLRIRFAREKDSSRAGTITSRRRCSSSVDLPATRRPTSRELIRSQMSFEMPGMQRPPLRLLGARPPPLIRRSSFPISQANQTATSSFCGTPNMRRQSVEADKEALVSALHHRIRLIRRH